MQVLDPCFLWPGQIFFFHAQAIQVSSDLFWWLSENTAPFSTVLFLMFSFQVGLPQGQRLDK
jgi:hypothetical protein